jgi:hypothetical protein
LPTIFVLFLICNFFEHAYAHFFPPSASSQFIFFSNVNSNSIATNDSNIKNSNIKNNVVNSINAATTHESTPLLEKKKLFEKYGDDNANITDVNKIGNTNVKQFSLSFV